MTTIPAAPGAAALIGSSGSSPVAWVIPGQGAQRVGMGAELFARFSQETAIADRELGWSVAQLCTSDEDGRLHRTQYLQPALFVVGALSCLARWDDGEPEPEVLAGHSLGEYVALFAAGSFDLATGVRLVRRRGELMGRAEGGGMAAVVGPDVSRVSDVLARYGLDDLDVANHNAHNQVVLSGPAASLQAAAKVLREERAGRCVPLAVSAPFHSRYMAPAAEEFARFLAGFALRDPQIPVIANVTAAPYTPGGVADLLARQVRSSVRWADSMRLLLENGVQDVVEVGPGNVLRGLWAAARAVTEPAGERGSLLQRAPRIHAAPVASTVPPLTRRMSPSVISVPVAPSPELANRSRAAAKAPGEIRAEDLGSAAFRDKHGLRYAYLAGAMYKGISSVDLVVRMSRAGLLGYFGAGGLRLSVVEEALQALRRKTGPNGRFGMNLLHALHDPALELSTARLYTVSGVRHVEAAGFSQLTPALVHCRFAGAYRDREGRPTTVRSVLAKVSRPEVAEAFLSPPSEAMLRRVVADGLLTAEEAEIARLLPVSADVCVEADSGGHTDQGAALALLPAMVQLRDEAVARLPVPVTVALGAAGGLGTPASVAAAFVLGADFVLTGSVNQCSVEAGTSDAVKDMLAAADVQDTAYAPAGDMFELGAQVQVLRRGTLFAARANKLYQVYRQHDSLDDLAPELRRTVEQIYFGRSLDEVWRETTKHYRRAGLDAELARAECDPKRKLALVLRWYFVHTTRAALRGALDERVDYQVHTGPAIGAFNRFARGTALQDWRKRHVDEIADLLMTGAAGVLEERLRTLSGAGSAPAHN